VYEAKTAPGRGGESISLGGIIKGRFRGSIGGEASSYAVLQCRDCGLVRGEDVEMEVGQRRAEADCEVQRWWRKQCA